MNVRKAIRKPLVKVIQNRPLLRAFGPYERPVHGYGADRSGSLDHPNI
jgi:hypothetical protein